MFLDENDIFGEVSSSDDEGDVNIMDSGDEASRDAPGRGMMEGEDSRGPSGFFRTDSTTQMSEMFSEEADNGNYIVLIHNKILFLLCWQAR